MSQNTAADYTAIITAEMDIQLQGRQALEKVLNECGYVTDDIVGSEPATAVRFRDGIPTLIVGFDYICWESGELRCDGEVYITRADGTWRADYRQVF